MQSNKHNGNTKRGLAIHLLLIWFENAASFEVIQVDGIFSNGKPILRDAGSDHTDYLKTSPHDFDSGEELKALLEAKYKFRNDETSTRYRISHDAWDNSDSAESKEDQKLAWVFRSYAARRIVGGMETSISMYPYNVAISRNAKHWCGGSVIDEQWILTAGHCLESAFNGDAKKLMPYIVRAGSSFHNRGGYQSRVNKVFFPPKYSPGNADYDFSLARLDRPMPIGRNIAVLNLPSKEYVIKPDDILIVTGWGSTDQSGYGSIPDRLRFVPVPAMNVEDCQRAYRFYITPRMLCAGYATGGKDACNHDSGGPAVRDGVLLGIVSFGGKKCGDPQSPGVYSRVSEITSWVESTITANEASSVPELLPKIFKARQREKELQKWSPQPHGSLTANLKPLRALRSQLKKVHHKHTNRFKAQVEDKKNKIKHWLRETLSSPKFLELAKKKLKEAGFNIHRRSAEDSDNILGLDDHLADEVNLSNQINERILGHGEGNEAEAFLRMMAVQEIVSEKKEQDDFSKVLRNGGKNNALIAIIT